MSNSLLIVVHKHDIMALPPSQRQNVHLHAIVDMGSNGIRFSISTLQPPTARIMPTLYQHRVGISLYDAQYAASGERRPIDEQTISAVIASFQQFKRTCADFHVPEKQITVLATEATRTAINSEDFRRRIREHVGWNVTMLPKEEEGRVGAMGVASSLPEVSGLVMDLGGGSTQLSWLVKQSDRAGVQMPEGGAVSMPYGAAAMSRRLAEAERSGKVEELKKEVQTAVEEAYTSLRVPEELDVVARHRKGFTLYLSGGGFRGWGYILMSRHRVAPYPIPVINGFSVSRDDFLGTDAVKAAAVASLDGEATGDYIFRISERRAGQVPAVAFLVTALSQALPQIKEVRFCQGGVREGYLFTSLPAEVRAENPLIVATRPFDTACSSRNIRDLMLSALPSGSTGNATDDFRSTFTADLLEAFAGLMYYHSSHSKDLQATAALRSTTSGILAGVHGVLHESRSLLALLLCARWGGSVPPSDASFKQRLEALIESPWTLWWINYFGAVAALLAAVYPAGVTEEAQSRIKMSARWNTTGKGNPLLSLEIHLDSRVQEESLRSEIDGIEKVGKKKKWIGGKDGIGHRVEASLR